MELAGDKACICEGSAENAIMDILLDNDLLIFTRRKCWKKRLSDAEMVNALKRST